MIIENLSKEKQSNTIEQILYNRGIKDFKKYMAAVDGLVSPQDCIFLSGAKKAAAAIEKTIDILRNDDSKFIVDIVDSDCDGFTSSALFINFCTEYYGFWVKDRIKLLFHEGKQHGLSDHIDTIVSNADRIASVIVPDAGSNDVEQIKQLEELNIICVIMDHHEVEDTDVQFGDTTALCNNQIGIYENKDLSGVGVVYQVCRIINEEVANNYLDLVALGNTGDMMSLKSLETRSLITQGFHDMYTITNPFIKEMAIKQNYSLSKGDYQSDKMAITPMGASFFIVPFVNAICRSGTLEEKQLVFASMLNNFAYEVVASTKRGHKPGDTETIVEQALRVCTNVKNRQTKAETAGMELLEREIKKNPEMMKLSFLPFVLEPGQIESGVAGLAANKMMAKYQRPVFILTRVDNSYKGSARGYTKTGIESFKDICAATGLTEYTMGHANAFGLSVAVDDINDFVQTLEENMPKGTGDIVYYVDYIFKDNEIDDGIVTDIGKMNNLVGQDFDRPYVAINKLTITPDMVKVMKNNTIKIDIKTPDGVSVPIVIFGAEDELVASLVRDTHTWNTVCKCCINEWQGVQYPQLQLVDYEETEPQTWDFF